MLKIAVISDIHLGHNKNRASKIIENLRLAINDNPESTELDILFLAGDVFDQLLDLNSPDLNDIDFWICDTLRYCAKHDIVLRILEGTPSHDWMQSDRFMTIASILNLPKLDIQYITNVHIEYMERFDIHILYVPDEIQPTTEKTLSLVKSSMMAKGLDKVDYAIMHGQFEYQLPQHIKNIPRHNSHDYLSIVKQLIFIGHIHTHSISDRIVAQGSFDRLKHNEEEPKGYVKAFIENNERQIFFIENKNARTYKTLNCAGKELEESLKYIKKKVLPLRENSCVRINAESKHPIFSNMDELVRMYPSIVWSKRISDEKENDTLPSEEQNEIMEYNPTTISKENLLDLMRPRLELNFTDANTLLICENLIKEFL